MRLTFFGPPGSGKGTQASLISDCFGLKHISTGILLRDEINSRSELGNRIRRQVELGHLVSDEIVNEEVLNRIEKISDFLLDGYPRNLPQAECLDKFLEVEGKPLSGAVFIRVPDEEVINRLTGRLVCNCLGGIRKTADESYKEGDTCPVCGQVFVKRTDDSLDVIRFRLEQYHNLKIRLVKFYENRMLAVDGVGTVDQVYERIREELEKWA
jgi:adenylate kinase